MSTSFSATTIPSRFDSVRFALSLACGFALSLGLAWLSGRELIEALLPLVRESLLWLDDSFEILALGIDQNHQDTVIRLRVNATQLIIIGTQALWPRPGEWLEVTTTLGAMLQPSTIAVGLAVAWPGSLMLRLVRGGLALVLAIGFLLIDLPVTLYAYVWDMYIYAFAPEQFSPLLVWHEFLHAGGRLGIGVLIGVASAMLGSRIVLPVALIMSRFVNSG